jgi:hypothetical protein
MTNIEINYEVEVRKVIDGFMLIIPSPEGGSHIRFLDSTNPDYEKYQMMLKEEIKQ